MLDDLKNIAEQKRALGKLLIPFKKLEDNSEKKQRYNFFDLIKGRTMNIEEILK